MVDHIEVCKGECTSYQVCKYLRGHPEEVKRQKEAIVEEKKRVQRERAEERQRQQKERADEKLRLQKERATEKLHHRMQKAEEKKQQDEAVRSAREEAKQKKRKEREEMSEKEKEARRKAKEEKDKVRLEKISKMAEHVAKKRRFDPPAHNSFEAFAKANGVDLDRLETSPIAGPQLLNAGLRVLDSYKSTSYFLPSQYTGVPNALAQEVHAITPKHRQPLLPPPTTRRDRYEQYLTQVWREAVVALQAQQDENKRQIDRRARLLNTRVREFHGFERSSPL